MTPIISILVILFLCFGLFFLLRKSKKNTNEDSNSSVVENSDEKSTAVAEPVIDIESLPEELRETYRIATDPSIRTKPVLYALVTCHHCIRTQKFLKENKIDFKLIHVDLFDDEVRKSIMKTLKTHNERGSFPTFVMPSGKTVVGFREHLLREAITNEPK